MRATRPARSLRILCPPAVAAILAIGCAGTRPHTVIPTQAAAAYRAGQQAAGKGRLAEAEADFGVALGGAADPDKAAWAQYQIASCYMVDPSHRADAPSALRLLIRNYPNHFLAARAQEDLDRLAGKKPSVVHPPLFQPDCGPRCLAYLCLSYHRATSLPELCKQSGMDAHGSTLWGLKTAAEKHGLSAEGMKVDAAYLRHLDRPAICWMRRSHFVCVNGTVSRLTPPFYALKVWDPTAGTETLMNPDDFGQEWDGYLLAVSPPKRDGRL